MLVRVFLCVCNIIEETFNVDSRSQLRNSRYSFPLIFFKDVWTITPEQSDSEGDWYLNLAKLLPCMTVFSVCVLVTHSCTVGKLEKHWYATPLVNCYIYMYRRNAFGFCSVNSAVTGMLLKWVKTQTWWIVSIPFWTPTRSETIQLDNPSFCRCSFFRCFRRDYVLMLCFCYVLVFFLFLISSRFHAIQKCLLIGLKCMSP